MIYIIQFSHFSLFSIEVRVVWTISLSDLYKSKGVPIFTVRAKWLICSKLKTDSWKRVSVDSVERVWNVCGLFPQSQFHAV